jgi:predicted metalloprotease with PDZ domain
MSWERTVSQSLCAIAFAWATLCLPLTAESAKYKIALDFTHPLHATVNAVLDAPDHKLFTARHAGGYAWWDFIKDVYQVRADGSVVALPDQGEGHWTVAADSVQPFHIRYSVDLEFTNKTRIGDLRGGVFFGDSIYLVNRALFLMSNATGSKEIEFDVPNDFAIASPWTKVGERSFRVPDNRELSENWTVLGNFPTVDFGEGRLQVTFAFPGADNQEQLRLQPIFHPVLHEYLRIFPQTPATHLYFAFFHGAEDNGEGYLNSTTLTMAEPVTDKNRILWTNLLAHELFHHWNGGLLVPEEDQKTSWFSEGVTEYVANRTISRANLISEALFLKKLETHVAMYDYWIWAPPFQKFTLETAGSDKDFNRPAVYSGGVVAAFCLDTMIQQKTGGAKSLDDLLRVMMDRYGVTRKQWKSSDLVRDTSEVVGGDVGSFFARYVVSREPLPVQQCLRDAGLNASLTGYAGEAFIQPDEGSSPQARTIRDRLLRVVQQ